MSQDFGFDWAIAPLTRDEFFNTYFEKKHVVVKRGQPDYYSSLLSFAQIDHVVTTMGLYSPEITVTKSDGHAHGTDSDTDAAPKPATDSDTTAKPQETDSDTAPATDSDTHGSGGHGAHTIQPGDYSYESGYIDPVRVAQLFADGATVILSGLHERLPQLGLFCRALENALSCRAQTNIYMTPTASQGFRPHYDSHDVLVLQVEGTKEWRIYDTPVELPLNSQGFNPHDVPIGEETDRFVLEPGDMCYVPRGLAHDAVATDETSLHITTGLMTRSWADLMAEAVNVVAHKDAAFRHALPPGFANPGFDASAYEQTFRDLMHKLADTAPFAPLLSGFKQEFIANRVPRVEGQLAQVGKLGDLSGDSIVGARPHLVYDMAVMDGGDGKDPSVSVLCYGAEITLPAHAETALRYALETPSFRLADMPGDLDDAGKIVLVKRLVREGMMVLHD
ncbi:cupin domain-containing protein [Fontisubflavum oceani]|uniref:cupin domain-containing protein n=1 Tax=Fontisubflavum oceani TaxID=2978973 RepID=UPI0025B561BA|nr:cupin domain-containing protein [Fontisubflavum oceani]WJY22377.1 cupin domain-containing protein [Fontisubflavum oceani]